MKRCALAARRIFPWKSGTSKLQEKKTGDACRKSSPRSMLRARRAWTSPPILTATLRGSTAFPHSSRRGRMMAMTPSEDWDNEWQEIAGPESVLIGVVQNPKLLPLQGKTLAQVAKLWNKDPIDALCDLLIEDNAFTNVAVFGMSEPDVALV